MCGVACACLGEKGRNSSLSHGINCCRWWSESCPFLTPAMLLIHGVLRCVIKNGIIRFSGDVLLSLTRVSLLTHSLSQAGREGCSVRRLFSSSPSSSSSS